MNRFPEKATIGNGFLEKWKSFSQRKCKGQRRGHVVATIGRRRTQKANKKTEEEEEEEEEEKGEHGGNVQLGERREERGEREGEKK